MDIRDADKIRELLIQREALFKDIETLSSEKVIAFHIITQEDKEPPKKTPREVYGMLMFSNYGDEGATKSLMISGEYKGLQAVLLKWLADLLADVDMELYDCGFEFPDTEGLVIDKPDYN